MLSWQRWDHTVQGLLPRNDATSGSNMNTTKKRRKQVNSKRRKDLQMMMNKKEESTMRRSRTTTQFSECTMCNGWPAFEWCVEYTIAPATTSIR